MRVGDLFCGVGGMGLGAVQAGCEIVWAIDRSHTACLNYFYNISERVINADAKLIDFAKLPEIDAIIIDMPDKDVSKTPGVDDVYGFDKQIYRTVIDAVTYTSPLLFAISVPTDIVNKNDGLDLAQFTYDLENAGVGYKLTAHIFNANDYSVAQNRYQLFIFGVQNYTGIAIFPPKKHKIKPIVKDVLLINDDLNDRPPLATGDVPRERLKHILPGESAYTSDIPDHLMLSGGVKQSNRYRRVHPDHPSFAIRGAVDYTVCGYHHSEPRLLTNRERLRLFGYPDSYKTHGRSTKVMRLIGKSTPPPLARAIFSIIMDILDDNYSNTIDCNVELSEVFEVSDFITAFSEEWTSDSIMEV